MGKYILSILETELKTPKPYGMYHLIWLICTLFVIILLFFRRNKNNEKQLKIVIGTYSIIAFILEALKQFIWAVEYDSITNSFIWDYQWYAFPFQFCTMPMYVCLICLFLNKNKIRNALLSFVAFTTILGSIASAIIPDTLFVSDVLINIHAMWLHLGSLVVSIYLIMSKEVKLNIKSYFSGIMVFLITIILANILNVSIYNSGILNGETFNMFYISPYFASTLPVFDIIYKTIPYPLFLVFYFVVLSFGSLIIFTIAKVINKINYKNK